MKIRQPDPTDPRAGAEPEMADEERDFAERVAAAIALLEGIRDDPGQLALLDQEQRNRLLIAAGRVARPGPWAKRELAHAARARREAAIRAADEQKLSMSGIRIRRQEAPAARQLPEPLRSPVAIEGRSGAAKPRRVLEPRNCYVCKVDYRDLHEFYDSLCPDCARLNWEKRHQSADLTGRVALITGGRVKIGYQASLMLLRAGARVVVTTRFPRDAAARYAGEPDAEVWGQKVEIHGLDLRHAPSVEGFARHLDGTLDRLDFLINNACQTVRRPAGFYAHLMAAEAEPYRALPAFHRRALSAHEALREGASARLAPGGADPDARGLPAAPAPLADSARLSQLALLAEDRLRGGRIFPAGELDGDLQQVDLRGRNSWRLTLSEVSAVELLEVQLVNAVAPFLLNARLKPLLLRVSSRDKHIVNVSAVEGQFRRSFKTDKHPHTNMAKAALNMMTRTSAADYVRDGIHMNSVDTGWVTDEDPVEIAARKTREQGFHPPLDVIDGAARICDPIFSGFLSGTHVWGLFLKDYRETSW